MTKYFTLAFSAAGILNPSQLKFISDETEAFDLILFGDGTQLAVDKILEFVTEENIKSDLVSRIGIGVPPLYDLRVINESGELSLPNYVYDEETRSKWFCSNVASPHVEIIVSDTAASSPTKTKVTDDLKDVFCYRSYCFWKILQTIEKEICFPAMVIDKMTRWTHKLTPQTMDITLLRNETGIQSLDYSSSTDLLSMRVGEEDYVVKLSLLDEIYGKMILKQFNLLLGRRLNISVSISGSNDEPSDFIDMSYGELGSIIDGMHIYTKEMKITNENPIKGLDLIELVKNGEINDQTCIWLEKNESFASQISKITNRIVRRNNENDE